MSTLRSRSNTRPSSSRGDSPAEQPSAEDKGKGRSKDDDGEGTEYGRYMGLPAVKGTLGGIESPRRGHFPSSSVSTLREIQVSSPTPSNRDQEATSPEGSTDQSQSQPRVERQWQFRIDPTIKTTLDSAPFGPSAREELKRLFGV